jgi:hypothetical protein
MEDEKLALPAAAVDLLDNKAVVVRENMTSVFHYITSIRTGICQSIGLRRSRTGRRLDCSSPEEVVGAVVCP